MFRKLDRAGALGETIDIVSVSPPAQQRRSAAIKQGRRKNNR